MEALYADRLVEVFPDHIVFHRYYLPFYRYGSRTVRLTGLSAVEKHENTLRTGKWRIWGTGDFRTWFPADGARSSRPCIFVAIPRNPRAMRIGFTAENSDALAHTLTGLGLLRDRTGADDG